ncbi:MAG: hypothetical protein A3D35_02990 [Candidatus Staskawiczbacteria bacterium RIFCSPHIGHO2_02_FULL_34_9]|uniref:Response regulatory domain-containing protein n=1 Tax=Candidatus Staskawiczbacteria bacterium RIFCSPHIGHO2_02_FULL_34_9 TaxID=1802206 RepID=A0A1G2I327_9BACT|nr:MAG: hypothetical protein A3D35_02990 [Candidatus Staskawiczbacteria bacterium RIFCSPHIGHO2_02_FULL_34_9]
MKTILLVEDDPFILDVYYNQFKKEGYNVFVAKTVQDAMDKIKNNNPDLIVLDLNLSKDGHGPADGLNILEQIRRDPKTKNIKVVVSSNYEASSYPELSRLPELGVIKSFVKINLTPEELSSEVKEILK